MISNHEIHKLISEPSKEECQPDPAYEQFKEEFRKRTGILLSLYKEKQMKRRINTLIERKGMNNYQEFLYLLDSDPFEMTSFLDYITINVTEFFRTPDHWSFMEENALKPLMESPKKKIRIWSCACSTGEEPYSIVMSLAKLTDDLSRFKIIASDIDDTVLTQAREAKYQEISMNNVSPELRERFFTQSKGGYHLKADIHSLVKFKKIDLLQDPFPKDCDLIVCRNILIYFTEEAKEAIYQQIRKRLVPGGYLFTGNAEQIIYYRKYGLKKISGCLYQKVKEDDSSSGGNYADI